MDSSRATGHARDQKGGGVDGGIPKAATAESLGIDSRYAWQRLLITLIIGTTGGIGMWSVVVVLPFVQQDFGISRADASFAYTLTMLGFGIGGVMMGRLADRLGIFQPLVGGSIVLCLGFIASAHATNIWQFAIAQGLLIGLFGSSVSFGPLIADTSLWFDKRRGLAVAIAATGSYLGGTIWPPVVQALIAAYGWRHTHVLIGLICAAIMLPLALVLRRKSPLVVMPAAGSPAARAAAARVPPIAPGVLQSLLVIAGISCCVAMAMPQVHIVAYCVDLGYGPARGAEMLSLMLATGIVSRLATGAVADKLGALNTLLIGSALQAVALLLYVPFDGLMPLYIVSAFFGLVQGGIIPSYAIIVREQFPANEAGTRVGLVLTATMLGMAFGGWLSGVIFDFTGSYKAAFLNGFAWNLVNVGIVLFILWRVRRARSAGLRHATASPSSPLPAAMKSV